MCPVGVQGLLKFKGDTWRVCIDVTGPNGQLGTLNPK